MVDKYWSEYGIDSKRIAITTEQIREFGLQHLTNPDPEVVSKLRKDPNSGSLGKIMTVIYSKLKWMSCRF